MNSILDYNKKSTKGFTLIEMVLYVSILGIIVGVVILLATNLFTVFSRARVKRDIMADGDKILSLISSEVRKGNFIYSPTSIFDASSGQLSINTNFGAPQDENSTYIDFYLDNGRVYVKREGQNASPVNSERTSVTEFTFMDLTPSESLFNSVKVKLTLEALNAPLRIQSSVTFDTAFSIRVSN